MHVVHLLYITELEIQINSNKLSIDAMTGINAKNKKKLNWVSFLVLKLAWLESYSCQNFSFKKSSMS